MPPAGADVPLPGALAAALVEQSVDGVLAFDRACRYTVWNPAMERISGVPASRALGRHAFELFPFLVDTGEDRFFRAALAGETVVARDRPYRVPETQRIGFFEGHYGPLRDERGAVVGGLAIIREQSEQRFAGQLVALHEVSNELSKATSLDDLCRAAVELARRRLGFDRISIWFTDPDWTAVRGSFGVDEEGALRDERDCRVTVAPESVGG